MPKFNGQNKKKIDPRYFLHEKVEPDCGFYESSAECEHRHDIEKCAREMLKNPANRNPCRLAVYERDAVGLQDIRAIYKEMFKEDKQSAALFAMKMAAIDANKSPLEIVHFTGVTGLLSWLTKSNPVTGFAVLVGKIGEYAANTVKEFYSQYQKKVRDASKRGSKTATRTGTQITSTGRTVARRVREGQEMNEPAQGPIGASQNLPVLADDPEGFETFKKAIPLRFRIADDEETIETKEGPVTASEGDYIMVGTEGEHWPIPKDKFENTYDIITTFDQNPVKGEASKKKIMVFAKQMKAPFEVKVSWSSDLLSGDEGDYLVQYGPGDYGVVGREIFEKTYERGGEQVSTG